jgi:hypothetical protein
VPKWRLAQSLLKEGDNEASRSKSPTRQSRYGDGALQGIPVKANKTAVRAGIVCTLKQAVLFKIQ